MKIFVTGTDHGLGHCLALEYLKRGHTVFAGDYNPRTSFLADVEKEYPDTLVRFRLDVTSAVSVKEAVEVIKSHTNSLDIIINNAAILGDITKEILDELDFDEVKNVYDTNAVGALRVCHYAYPLLLNGDEKLLVHISSEAGSLGTKAPGCLIPRSFGYFMSKAAMNMVGRIMSTTMKDVGGRVILIHPLGMATYMEGYKRIAPHEPEEIAGKVADIAAAPEKYIPEGENICFINANGTQLAW